MSTLAKSNTNTGQYSRYRVTELIESFSLIISGGSTWTISAYCQLVSGIILTNNINKMSFMAKLFYIIKLSSCQEHDDLYCITIS